MPTKPLSGGRKTPWAAAGTALVLLISVLLVWIVVEQSAGRDSAEPAHTAARTAAPPPEPVPPFTVVDREQLTLPQKFRYAHGDFYLRAGESYLVSFELSTVKPEEAPGVGMYLGVTFSCDQDDGRGVGSIGGTENLLPGEPVTYVNHLVLRPSADGVHGCSVLVNAPYDDVAAKGTTVELDVTWRVDVIDGEAFEVETEQQLPMMVDTGAREAALEQRIPIDDLSNGPVEVLTSLHVTTCTGVNGSTEAGRTWCAAEDVDEQGSDFDIELRADVLDEDGAVCETLATSIETTDLDKWRHHHLIPLALRATAPERACGTELRVTGVIDNRGPAPLVVHESNTSMILVAGD